MVSGHDDLDLEDASFGVRLEYGIIAVLLPVLVGGFGRGLRRKEKTNEERRARVWKKISILLPPCLEWEKISGWMRPFLRGREPSPCGMPPRGKREYPVG